MFFVLARIKKDAFGWSRLRTAVQIAPASVFGALGANDLGSSCIRLKPPDNEAGNRLSILNTDFIHAPDRYRLDFSFSGADLLSPAGEMYFAYRLQGYEETWRTTQSPVVQYTNIAPGDYQFIVKAVNLDGLESPPVQVPISIRYFWWQTPIAWIEISAAAAALASIVTLGTREFRRKRKTGFVEAGHGPVCRW